MAQPPGRERPPARPNTPTPTAIAAPFQKASKRDNRIVWAVGIFLGGVLPISFIIWSGISGAQEATAEAALQAAEKVKTDALIVKIEAACTDFLHVEAGDAFTGEVVTERSSTTAS